MNKKSALFIVCLFNLFYLKAQTSVVDSIVYDGVWRNYRLFLPTGFKNSSHLPLVFNLHGNGSDAFEQEIYSGFDIVADTAHAVVCYPNGLNKSWNTETDPGYIDTLISFLYNRYHINRNRVYSTGMSLGGFMNYYLACELPGRFAAIASVSGTSTTISQEACSSADKIPVLHIHGTADNIVPYDGSPIGILSVSQILDYWAGNDQCLLMTDTVDLPDISDSDMCTAQKITFRNCDADLQIVLYRIIGGGHTWPGSPVIIGVTNEDFNASGTIWNFFNRFSLTKYDDNSYTVSSFNIYPNPSSAEITISNPGNLTASVSIFQSDGKVIFNSTYNEKKIQMDLSFLNAGLYFIKAESGGSEKVFKFIRIKN